MSNSESKSGFARPFRRVGWQNLAATVLIALALFQTDPVQAAKATSISITASTQTRFERPDFQVPNDPRQLFFLQRSMNANTIVYAIRLDENGNINAKSPVDIYWRRFNDGGERKELSMIERNLAFGINVRNGSKPGEYLIEFKALKGRFMTLSLDETGKVRLSGTMGGRRVTPSHIFVDLDESGFFPKVKYLYLHGKDIETGSALRETLKVSGGEVIN